MNVYVIMHNTIFENECTLQVSRPSCHVDHQVPIDFANFLVIHRKFICDVNAQEQLQNDLIDHLWKIRGGLIGSMRLEHAWPKHDTSQPHLGGIDQTLSPDVVWGHD